ncbi:hypothetical protein NXS19_009718 [Fusarium pseudograminearum]|nr:hypothetical protein NXS19_009718 [Fusarium pseudograminearum]
MEPVSLAFGVLPVVGEAVKTCKVVRRKLKLFRHYSRELRRVQKRVGRQSRVFSNEIHLLLRPSLQDEDVVEVMLKDQDHPKWTSQDLEDGMRNSLGDNYTSCREIIEDIGSTLTSLQSVFDCFDQALDQCDENEHPRDAIRRLREGTKIAYSESKLEQNIKDLNQSLEELKIFREQTEQLNKPIDAVPPRRTIRKHTNLEYSHIRKTRESCKALHEAFTIAWARNTRHGLNHEIQHTVRLFLNTEVQTDVYMNAVITCNSCLNERAIDVRIRSQNHDSILGLPTPASSEASTSSHDGQRKKEKFNLLKQAHYQTQVGRVVLQIIPKQSIYRPTYLWPTFAQHYTKTTFSPQTKLPIAIVSDTLTGTWTGPFVTISIRIQTLPIAERSHRTRLPVHIQLWFP